MGNASSNKIIRVANHFTDLVFKYTQEEMDILFFLMSIIRNDRLEYTFKVSDIEAVSGREINNTRFRESIVSLGKRPYEDIRSENNWDTFFLFVSLRMRDGLMTVTINQDLIPILCDLKSEYTSLQLASGFRLNGKYSKRLYLSLARWKRLGGYVYEVDKLMTILQYERKDKSDGIGGFKRLVTRAVADINENTEINVGAEWIKTGKRVTHVKFAVRKGKRCNDVLDYSSDIELLMMKKELVSRGISEEMVERLHAEGCTMSDVRKIMDFAIQAVNNGTRVSHPGAYLTECFRKAGFLKEEDDRQRKIETYRRLIESGTQVDLIEDLLIHDGISMEEVLNINKKNKRK
ncbi:MAG: replication initiation protein [Bacteroidales bacterium]|nr:replication initiation protein [Bacteroidales bacterium]